MESIERQKARFAKLINSSKEKFKNKDRFPSSNGQLQIQEGVFSGLEHCHTRKSDLKPREGGGLDDYQMQLLWIMGMGH